MEDDKFKDLLEDEELKALRLAALATKKKNEKSADNSLKAVAALPIDSIVTSSETVLSQIPFLQSDRNAFHNNYAWRKLNQSMRRRGGAFPKKSQPLRRRAIIKLTVKSVKPHKKYRINKSRYKKISPLNGNQDSLPFQKNNQRSNLIVISPVALNEGKDSEEKAPALLLPQHKWSNSGNEDSMSPKTLRKTGPTRFNRHGSDSESSDDSDFEPSDNDSGSNETVLQDEPSEKFSRLSPDSDSVSDDVEKKRRLSFQRLDSDVKADSFDKTETTSVYNLLKKQDSYAPGQSLSDGRHNWSHSVEGEYGSYKQYNSGRAYTTKRLDAPESFSVKQTNLSVTSNGESSVDKPSPVTQSTEKSNTWHHVRNRTSDSYPENSRHAGSNDQKFSSYFDKLQSLPESSEMQSLKHSTWQHGEEHQASSSFYPRETTHNNSKNTSKSQLCESDLRLELKKRMQEASQSAVSDSNDTTQNKYDQRNASEKNRLRYAYDESKIGDSFVNKQESSIVHTDKSNDQDSFTPSQRKGSESHENDLSDNFGSAGKRKFQYSERSRYNRSSSLGRSRSDRNSRSPSRDRNRHDRSSSWDRRCDRSSSPNKSKSTYREGLTVRSRSSVERNFSMDRKTDQFKSSQNRRLSERSSSRDRSKRDRSSSSGSRHSHSLSREKSRCGYYSSRSKRSRSGSRNKNRHRRSLSRDRHSHSSSRSGNRYSRSNSRDRSRSRSSSDHSRSREWSKCSSNQEESRANQSTSKDKSASQNSASSSKYSFSHKSKCSASFSQEQSRKDSVLNHEQGSKNSQHKKIEYTQSSMQMLNKEFEKSGSKEQSKSVEESRLQATESSDKKSKIKRSRKFNRGNDSFRNQYSRSRSSSSESYSSSFSSSSSYDSKLKLRSVPSVVKPVVTKKFDIKCRDTPSESKTSGKSICSAISKSDTYPASKLDAYKKSIDVGDNKLSSIKCRIDGDLKVSDINKRVPVHMRLGVFPRKRVIQMPKDVEAAFVNTSSSSDSENVNTKCKKQNLRIFTNLYEVKSGVDSLSMKPLPAKRSPDMFQEKSKRPKAHR